MTMTESELLDRLAEIRTTLDAVEADNEHPLCRTDMHTAIEMHSKLRALVYAAAPLRNPGIDTAIDEIRVSLLTKCFGYEDAVTPPEETD